MNRRSSPNQERAVSIRIAAELTGVEIHTLRFWEQELPEFIVPLRTPGGQRRYRPADLQNILILKRLLKDELFSIAGARRRLGLDDDRRAA